MCTWRPPDQLVLRNIKFPRGHSRPKSDILVQEAVLPQNLLQFYKFSFIRLPFSFIIADLTQRIQNRYKSKIVLQDNRTNLGTHKRLNEINVLSYTETEISGQKAGLERIDVDLMRRLSFARVLRFIRTDII
jgi:hypothetical protein